MQKLTRSGTKASVPGPSKSWKVEDVVKECLKAFPALWASVAMTKLNVWLMRKYGVCKQWVSPIQCSLNCSAADCYALCAQSVGESDAMFSPLQRC